MLAGPRVDHVRADPPHPADRWPGPRARRVRDADGGRVPRRRRPRERRALGRRALLGAAARGLVLLRAARRDQPDLGADDRRALGGARRWPGSPATGTRRGSPTLSVRGRRRDGPAARRPRRPAGRRAAAPPRSPLPRRARGARARRSSRSRSPTRAPRSCARPTSSPAGDLLATDAVTVGGQILRLASAYDDLPRGARRRRTRSTRCPPDPASSTTVGCSTPSSGWCRRRPSAEARAGRSRRPR